MLKEKEWDWLRLETSSHILKKEMCSLSWGGKRINGYEE